MREQGRTAGNDRHEAGTPHALSARGSWKTEETRLGGGGAPARDLLHKLGYMGCPRGAQGSENARFERQYGPPCTIRMHG